MKSTAAISLHALRSRSPSILRQHVARVFPVPNVGLQGAALRPSGAVLSILRVHRGRAPANRDGMPSFRTAPVAAAGQGIWHPGVVRRKL